MRLYTEHYMDEITEKKHFFISIRLLVYIDKGVCHFPIYIKALNVQYRIRAKTTNLGRPHRYVIVYNMQVLNEKMIHLLFREQYRHSKLVIKFHFFWPYSHSSNEV